MAVNMRRAFTRHTTTPMYFMTFSEGSYDDDNIFHEGVMSRPTMLHGVVNHFSDRDLLLDGSDSSSEGDGLEWTRYNAKLSTRQELKINDRVVYKGINYKVVSLRDNSDSGFFTYFITSHDPLV